MLWVHFSRGCSIITSYLLFIDLSTLIVSNHCTQITRVVQRERRWSCADSLRLFQWTVISRCHGESPQLASLAAMSPQKEKEIMFYNEGPAMENKLQRTVLKCTEQNWDITEFISRDINWLHLLYEHPEWSHDCIQIYRVVNTADIYQCNKIEVKA